MNTSFHETTPATENIYVRTPLIESVALRKYCAGRQVFLKLENCQPSGSFKLRGISNLCKYAISRGYSEVICSSGGNAGLATAYSAMQLAIPCHIVVSRKAPNVVCDKIRLFGATIELFGDVWEDSYKRAVEKATNSHSTFLVHPFDHPAVWQGHSTMIDEIAEDLNGKVPSLIVTCCGGGGLISGIVQGVRRNNWEKRTKILSMETEGTHSFHLSVKEGGQKVRLDEITSIVSSLAANEVCDQLLRYFRESKPPILSRLVTDSDAAEAVIRFINDHGFLVGLACGATLSSLYKGIVERILTNNEDEYETIYDNCDKYEEAINNDDGPVVIVVCGGAEITLANLEEYRKTFDLFKI